MESGHASFLEISTVGLKAVALGYARISGKARMVLRATLKLEGAGCSWLPITFSLHPSSLMVLVEFESRLDNKKRAVRYLQDFKNRICG